MKLVCSVNAIIYGKDNPERKPDPTVCRFDVGITTPSCEKNIKLLKSQRLKIVLTLLMVNKMTPGKPMAE
jgi:hypothetical protein